VSLQLEALSNRVDGPPESMQQQLRFLRRRVDDYLREARESIWELRSPSAHREDLVTALRQVGEQATAGSPVSFEFVSSGAPVECPRPLEDQLLRIAREAIQNSVRHAGAQMIQLSLECELNRIRMRIADDGCGFEAQRESGPDRHFGLKSMQERAELAGGRLTIVSNREQGTVVEAEIPLQPESYRYAS
jgi:signal transduction histidine kinase